MLLLLVFGFCKNIHVRNDFMMVNEIVSAAVLAQVNVRLHCDDNHFSITIDDEHDGDLHNDIVNP